MNKQDHISVSLKIIFRVKISNFFDVDPGSGMEIIRIREGRKSDPGSGINIPGKKSGIRETSRIQQH
jgi:hypothetical protein